MLFYNETISKSLSMSKEINGHTTRIYSLDVGIE